MVLRLLGEVSLFFVVHRVSGAQVWIWIACACRLLEGICFSVRKECVKGVADWGAGSIRPRGREGHGVWGRPVEAEAGIMLHQGGE